MSNLEKLESIGYKLKSKLNNETLDLIINHKKFPKMINLSNDTIQVINPINSNDKGVLFKNIYDFINYYS